MPTPISNFGLVTVSGTYGSGSTSISLASGHGAKLPATTGGYRYPLTWWNATTYPHPADDPQAEIVIVTARSGDTLTVVRGQDGTSASNKNTASVTYRMSLGATKALLEEFRNVRSTHQGLVMQTSRHSSLAHLQVELVGVDWIAMDDGTVLRNDSGQWTGQTADITISGGMGLDTGAEQSSPWYEIYAIADETTNYRLLLHEAKRIIPAASYLTGEDASQLVRSATTNQLVSQGLQLSTSGTLRYIDLKLRKVGTPTGLLSVDLRSNAAGVPGSVLEASFLLDVSRLPTAATWVRIPFLGTAALSTSTQYHLVVGGTWTINGTSYVEWRMDGSAGTYSNGSKAMYNGTSWTVDTDDDLQFAVQIDHGETAVSLPTNYTKKCLLGWVYNDGNSNFVPFVQRGRTRRSLALVDPFSIMRTLVDAVEIADFTAMIPPIESCTVDMAIAGTGSGAGILAIGDVRAWDISYADGSTGAQVVIHSGSTTVRPGNFYPVLVQRSSGMMAGTVGAKVWVAGFSW